MLNKREVAGGHLGQDKTWHEIVLVARNCLMYRPSTLITGNTSLFFYPNADSEDFYFSVWSMRYPTIFPEANLHKTNNICWIYDKNAGRPY